MSIEANKALVRRHYREVLNQRNAAVIDELYDPAFVTHLSDGSTLGLDRFKQAAAMTHNAFPDLLVVVEDQIAAGDKVVTRSTARGTHRGDFVGIPATEKRITLTGIHIHRVAGEKIVGLGEEIDLFGLMQQLGALGRNQ